METPESFSVEKKDVKKSVMLPKKLLDRILEDSKKKYAGLSDHGAFSRGLVYFSARGLLEWEREHSKSSGKSLNASAKKKKKSEPGKLLKSAKQEEPHIEAWSEDPDNPGQNEGK